MVNLQFHVSGVEQSFSCTYISFFRFFSHIGYYKVLSIVPCAIYQLLAVYLFSMLKYAPVNHKFLI